MRINLKRQALLFSAHIYGKILSLAIVLLLAVTAFPQSPCSAPVGRKEITIAKMYTEVEVKGDITVILTNAPAGDIMVEGNSNELSAVKATVKKGRLIIDAEKKKCNTKLTVFVSVNNVDTLIINREAEIFSFGKVNAVKFK